MNTQRSSKAENLKSNASKSAIVMAVLCLGAAYGAESQDFKTYDAQESYIVDGAPVLLTQKIGQVTVKFAATTYAVQSPDTLTAANGEIFNRSFAFPDGLTIYSLQTNTRPVSFEQNAAAIASLNLDPTIQFAYPVYVNPNTGNRVFLNDEIIVPSRLSGADVVQTFKLRMTHQISAIYNIYLFKLTDPKAFNPFKVCDAIRTRTNLPWAEPNFAGEANLYVPSPIVSLVQLTGNMYELELHAICHSGQNSSDFKGKKITSQTLIQEAADQSGISDTGSLALVYHVNADPRGDVIQVVNRTDGTPVWDAFSLLYSKTITNSNASEMRQYSFVYSPQQSDPVGGAAVIRRVAFDRNGNPLKEHIRGTIQCFLPQDPTNGLRLLSGTFFTGKQFVPATISIPIVISSLETGARLRIHPAGVIDAEYRFPRRKQFLP